MSWLDAIDIIPGPYEYDQEIRVAVMLMTVRYESAGCFTKRPSSRILFSSSDSWIGLVM